MTTTSPFEYLGRGYGFGVPSIFENYKSGNIYRRYEMEYIDNSECWITRQTNSECVYGIYKYNDDALLSAKRIVFVDSYTLEPKENAPDPDLLEVARRLWPILKDRTQFNMHVIQ